MKLLQASIIFCIILTMFLKEVQSSEENETSLRPFQTRRQIVAKKIGAVWHWIKYKIGPTGNEFLARCAGGFKVLRIVLFAIVFKLGIILTTMGFLTIFSLKGLALLVLLVIMNVTGFATKLAIAKNDGGWGHHGGPHPYNRGAGTDIHLHVHTSNKDNGPQYIEIPHSAPSSPYRVRQSSPAYGGWASKNDVGNDSGMDTVDMFLGGRKPTEEDFQRYLRIRNLYDASTQ